MYNSYENFINILNTNIDNDLCEFKVIDQNIINYMDNLNYRGFRIKFINNKVVILNEKSAYELRNQRILEFFVFLSKNYKLPNIEFIIHTDDKPPTDKLPMLMQSKKYNSSGILYPDFSFIKWDWPAFPEASVDNWDIFRNDICNYHIDKKDKINKCFFRGAATNPIRNYFMDRSINNTNFDIDITVGANSRKTYIPLKHHTRYKYLLNLPGNSSSGRLKYLFLMDSVVFDIKGEYKEFWYHILKNEYHFFQYFSKDESFDLLNEKIIFLETNDQAYDIIIKNCKEIQQYFTYQSVIQYWLKLFEEYYKKINFKVTV